MCIVGEAGLVGVMPAGDGLAMFWFDVDGPFDPERFRGYRVDDLLGEDMEPFRHVRHRVPESWGRGNCTLLGDAAHAFPPTQAQGANQAFEDAWLLGRTLHGSPADVPAALRRYEALRTRRVRKVSRRAASERTNRPLPAPIRALTARLPLSLVGAAYTAQIRGMSSVLNGETVRSRTSGS